MIGRLSGAVLAHDLDGTLVIDVHGVGYELLTPLGTIGRAHANSDGRVTFFVHTHVREDQLTLFGFATEEDRATFRTLLGVSNVGPRIALAVLTALPAHELAQTIAQKDLTRLTKIPGIGKKTAELMLLQLRDKLSAVTSTATPTSATRTKSASAGMSEVLVGALTKLGYKSSEAERAANTVLETAEGKDIGALVRESLAVLSK